MRLHRLRVSAFGPFSDEVDLDLDELGAAGLFLVHGATGAGKTSLLDAICFALYAAVPGTRPTRGLRSDHAPRDAVPTVELELTAGGRRLRIRRTAEFMRPKKRGEGERRIQASVVLAELRGRSWVELSVRPDEVGEIVTDVLGMGRDQFTSVVFLPQGDFAAFLRAGAEERRALLEQLFDVSRFSGVEDWLADRRRELAGQVADRETALRTDLSRLADAVADLPAEFPGGPGGTGAGPEDDAATDALATLRPAEVPAAVAALDAAVDEWSTQALAELADAESRATSAAEALSRAEHRAAARRRGDAATAVLAELTARADDLAEAGALVAAARRAAPVAGHLDALARDERAVRSAAARYQEAARDLDHLGVAAANPTDADRPGADSEVDALVDVAGRLAGSDEHLADLIRVRRRRTEIGTEQAALARRVEGAPARRDALDLRLRAALVAQTRAAAAVATAERAQTRLPETTAELDRSGALLQRRREQDAAEQARTVLVERAATCRGLELDARERLLDLQQQRLDGMAAELAHRLHDGDACPVCGATEHPSPASAHATVTAADIDEAATTLDRARADHTAVREELAAVHAAIAARADELADAGTADELADRRAALAATLEETTAVARTLDAARAAAGEAEGAVTAAREAFGAWSEEQAVATEAAARLSEELDRSSVTASELVTTHARECPCAARDLERHLDLDAEFESEPGPDTDPTQRHAQVRVAVDATLDAARHHVAARERHHGTAAALAEALDGAGFATAAEARTAALEPDHLDRLVRAVQDADRRRVAAETTLEDEQVRAVLATPAADEPDPEALAAAAGDARTQRHRCHTRQTLAERALEAVRRLGPVVLDHTAGIGPLAERHALVSELADAVGGTGGGNELRMKLSSFVLAARLERVAELANERLVVMGQGRFRLRHSDTREQHGRRSGLGLVVHDQWTGHTRPTTTLSGGETFMASLALALGLADAVREEAGGLDLQTLVIDEGFGSLDDDSLEQVMEVLDTLREGGRAVGVVSHVGDLRSRIPSQVHVRKTEVGSTVEVVRAAG